MVPCLTPTHVHISVIIHTTTHPGSLTFLLAVHDQQTATGTETEHLARRQSDERRDCWPVGLHPRQDGIGTVRGTDVASPLQPRDVPQGLQLQQKMVRFVEKCAISVFRKLKKNTFVINCPVSKNKISIFGKLIKNKDNGRRRIVSDRHRVVPNHNPGSST